MNGDINNVQKNYNENEFRTHAMVNQKLFTFLPSCSSSSFAIASLQFSWQKSIEGKQQNEKKLLSLHANVHSASLIFFFFRFQEKRNIFISRGKLSFRKPFQWEKLIYFRRVKAKTNPSIATVCSVWSAQLSVSKNEHFPRINGFRFLSLRVQLHLGSALLPEGHFGMDFNIEAWRKEKKQQT